MVDLYSINGNIDIASYEDRNAGYVKGNNIDEVVKSLQEASKSLFLWFVNNLMKSNVHKTIFE